MGSLTSEGMIVFSDLDGTLLDKDTYSFEEAVGAIRRLKAKSVPLVLASSKTRVEIEVYRRLLGNEHPFIVENGAAAFIPEGYFPDADSGLTSRDGYLLIEIGLPYDVAREALLRLKERTGLSIRGLGDMTVEELSILTDLPPGQAALAKRREYTEPFVLEHSPRVGQISSLVKRAAEMGLTCTVGERFLHLGGRHDKGELVTRLVSRYRSAWGDAASVGLGDGKNDIEMLAACEVAVVIRKKNGLVDEDVVRSVPGALIYDAGPAGWGRAIYDILDGRVGLK
ncbi:MAG: HAD-IIB family hydrolase [Candidatus Eisenbacteria bacterium]